MEHGSRQKDRVRKRAPNACNRCRQQKIKCSGSAPCSQCSKKDLVCAFDGEQRKVVVTRAFLDDLERQAGLAGRRGSRRSVRHQPVSDLSERGEDEGIIENDEQGREQQESSIPLNAARASVSATSDSEPSSRRVSFATDQHLTNPLVSDKEVYTADSSGKPMYLGTSSNWSFGRRILSTAHERVFGSSLPPASLLFEGKTYDLGWDGLRTPINSNETALPTADFALFLINAVKFHCCQLFHLFDEQEFMRNFAKFHDNIPGVNQPYNLWYVHYLLILALGKAFIVRIGNEKRPPGADLFVQAMKLLPDATCFFNEPFQAIETLCCAALYLQCIDMRSAAYCLIGQAGRVAQANGIHTDMQTQHHSEIMMERCREIWWTVYILDSQMSSLMGMPLTIAEHDISARLPSFAGSIQKSTALGIHVKLAKITTMILRTVYGEDARIDSRFLISIKNALQSLAKVDEERDKRFRIDLKDSTCCMSRVSAHLHLFHHQCIILTTRPLLYSFWQKRVESVSTLRVTSRGGVRSLLRICVASAQESLRLLAALQAQSLLESFLPFDLESIWSSALALMLTNVVDPSLIRGRANWLPTVYPLLDEMIARGNLVAGFRKAELQQLDATFEKLFSAPSNPELIPNRAIGLAEGILAGCDLASQAVLDQPSMHFDSLQDWDSEEGLTGEQLLAVAESLDFTTIDWPTDGTFGSLDPALY